jgi:uncharacterized membrane protein
MTLLALDPYVTDWLNLLIRGLHVVAAIAWIGGSFYFMMLDNQLEPPERDEDRARGVAGESWEIHGGGFYRVEKFAVAPERLPKTLHWTKWQAYTTWLSGFALLVVLYYLNADQYLVGPSSLATGWLVAISIALLVVAWVVYDVVCRTIRSELAIGAIVLALVTLAAWGSYELFAPRAAWLQVGAMLGTIMVANVFFVIIPAHWELVRAKERGEAPDPRHGLRGKQRSVHNNYFTLPVLLTMLAGHFAFATGRARGWLVLVVLMVLSALVRHFYNRRHAGTNLWWIPAGVTLAIVGLAFLLRPQDSLPRGAASHGVSFAAVERIVNARCVPCHSENPTFGGIDAAPMGIELDDPDAIVRQAQAIKTQAVVTKQMPLGNATQMTEEERQELGAWVDGGAKR